MPRIFRWLRWTPIPVGQRVAITVIIVLTVLFALAIIGYMSGDWEKADSAPGYQLESASVTACIPERLRDRAKMLLDKAFDDALSDQVMHLYEVWMKDDTDQPARAAKGTRQALNAWVNAKVFLEKWNPPECKDQG